MINNAPFQFGLLDPNFNAYNPTPEEDLHNYLFKLGLNTFVAIKEVIGRMPTREEQLIIINRLPEAWASGLRDELEIMTYVTKGLYSFNPASKAN